MKANELMIGDWVLINGTPRKIQAVDGVDDEIMADDELYTLVEDRYHSEDRVEGVPLTPEILEKNGWEWNGELWVNDNFLIENGYDNHNRFWWSIFNSPLLPINSVHDLQHALRLCGIEKEIEL